MSHRATEFSYGYELGRITLTAVVNIGSSGAPTLEQWNVPVEGGSTGATAGFYSAASTSTANGAVKGTQGVASIARVSEGYYTITLQEPCQRLLDFHVTQIINNLTAADLVPSAPDIIVQGSSTLTDPTGLLSTAGTPVITFACSLDGVLAEIASGTQLLITLVLSDSTTI